MIEDIIEVEALDAYVDAVEIDVLKWARVDRVVRVEACVRNLVVASCFAVEQVDAEHAGVQAQVELRTSTLFTQFVEATALKNLEGGFL
jgi:hypothetical protein